VSQTDLAAAVQGDGDTGGLVAMYEELRSWVLHPGHEASLELRRLGHVLLVRNGMRAWMVGASSLHSPAGQTPPARASTSPPVETSTTTQLAASLANVVLSCLREAPHEP
jgi:hypothetical protein